MDILPPKISMILSLCGMCLAIIGNALDVATLIKLGQILLTAGISAFLVHLLVLVLLERARVQEPDLRLFTYLKAFFSDWLTIMSGPFSVLLTVVALWSTQRIYKILFGIFAVICAIFGSYRVWRKERLAAYSFYDKYAGLKAEFLQKLRIAFRNAELQWSSVRNPQVSAFPQEACIKIDEFCAAIEELYSECPAEVDSQLLRNAIEKLRTTRTHRLGNLVGSQDELNQVCELMSAALTDVQSMLQRR